MYLRGHRIGALSVWLERRRHLTRVFAQQFLRALAAHDPHGGGIDLQESVLVMEDHPLARTFEQRAKLLFRFAQGALRAFALGVVDDAGANQVLTLRGQTQQPDFGGNEPAIWVVDGSIRTPAFPPPGLQPSIRGQARWIAVHPAEIQG